MSDPVDPPADPVDPPADPAPTDPPADPPADPAASKKVELTQAELDAMIAKAVESMREPPEDVEALGARLAKLDDNAVHITDK